jgi:hypothetical protein
MACNCRSRLAGEGDLTDAFAGKPGSYRRGTSYIRPERPG